MSQTNKNTRTTWLYEKYARIRIHADFGDEQILIQLFFSPNAIFIEISRFAANYCLQLNAPLRTWQVSTFVNIAETTITLEKNHIRPTAK